MLQYGASEGELELRQQIAQNLCERGLSCTEEQVLIISGSQQGIDLVAKLFIDEGTPSPLNRLPIWLRYRYSVFSVLNLWLMIQLSLISTSFAPKTCFCLYYSDLPESKRSLP